jgi:hypothetical protein
MRGQGFLCVVCVLLIAAGATSCRLDERRAKPAQTTQDGGWALDVRQAPSPKAPKESRTARSDQVGICDPGASPVMIVVVESPRKVKSASALWKDTPIMVQDPEVVVFADGRIVTSSPEAAGEHLQSLGWAHRDIEIVGGLPAAAGAWQRRRG